LKDATVLWAKKDKNENYWLPLNVHLADTAEIAKKLWRQWLPENVRQIIAVDIDKDEEAAEQLIIFLAAAHDIGKATPVFQSKLSNFPATTLDIEIYERLMAHGLHVRESREKYSFYSKTPHALASQLLLENAKEIGLSDANLSRNVAVILGSHHGKPPDVGYDEILHAYPSNFGLDDDIWLGAQSGMVQLALGYSGYRLLSDIPPLSMQGQVLLSGLLIVADWISSNPKYFPLIPIDCYFDVDSVERARNGWSALKISSSWQPSVSSSHAKLYDSRFNYDPNEMQKAALSTALGLRKPGIMVIEAPMGTGKTEAALVVAEVFRNTVDSGGLFFALPTQATSDGIFPRLVNWANNLNYDGKLSVNLSHGKAQFNDDLNSIRLFAGSSDISSDNDDAGMVYAHQWFNGRKKAMLADFVVGTIDQLLLMALRQKHVMLRHLGLAGKIVIIDECHAYDAYMSQYLKMALQWLGTYGVPVVILSATLPGEKRREVIGAYLGDENISGDWVQCNAYPMITYTDGSTVKHIAVKTSGDVRAVSIEYLATDEVADKLEELLSGGGVAGIIMDTVQRAQNMAKKLRERFDTEVVQLIHSRFVATDRIDKEKQLRDTLGKDKRRPEKLIVVGTQVLEQSLDIDFDVMISDIAPMDLLLQRMGRLHRHERSRPNKLRQPAFFVTGVDGEVFEKGITNVYHEYLIMRTRDMLNDLDGIINLPTDITRLVNVTYDKDTELSDAKVDWDKQTEGQKSCANTYRMKKPSLNKRATIVGWLNTEMVDDPTGKRGEATVRDIEDSVEVLLIKDCFGKLSLINGQDLPNDALSDDVAKTIATQTISLPGSMSHPSIIGDVIKELESRTLARVSKWLESPWLSGELFLILDNDGATDLCGHKVSYNTDDGLVCVKIV